MPQCARWFRPGRSTPSRSCARNEGEERRTRNPAAQTHRRCVRRDGRIRASRSSLVRRSRSVRKRGPSELTSRSRKRQPLEPAQEAITQREKEELADRRSHPARYHPARACHTRPAPPVVPARADEPPIALVGGIPHAARVPAPRTPSPAITYDPCLRVPGPRIRLLLQPANVAAVPKPVADPAHAPASAPSPTTAAAATAPAIAAVERVTRWAWEWRRRERASAVPHDGPDAGANASAVGVSAAGGEGTAEDDAAAGWGEDRDGHVRAAWAEGGRVRRG